MACGRRYVACRRRRVRRGHVRRFSTSRVCAASLPSCCCQQQLCKWECDEFRKMGVDNAAVLHLAQAMEVTAQQVVSNTDAVMSHQFPPPTLPDLEQELAKVRSVLFPELEQLCPWECRLIQAYEDIKHALQLRFKGTTGGE